MQSAVLVTGGTGFIGGWTAVELLKRGHTVRTTVRSASKAAWVRAQIASQVDPGNRLTFAIADLTRDDGWDAAVEGCEHVLHVDAPVGVDSPRDPNDLIVPTRDGAFRVLRASCRARVQRVVLTSAIEACRPPLKSPDGVSDEHLWTDPKDPGLGPYRLAKTLAERAAWNFMANQSGPTTLTTIFPSAVLGPVFSAEYPHASQVVQRMLRGDIPAIPRVGFCVIDVRDVADLHIRAMMAAEAAGQRFIAASDWMWMADLANTLRSKLGDGAGKVPTRRAAGVALRLMALVDPPARFITPLLGHKHVFSAAKAQAVLGWRPRSAATTVVDAAQSALAVGAI
jgi:nucleoside-diphosphate-sugar epimerase